ncbi:MAG: hypothetical protein WC812_03320 [Candidatus Pacearchaeota archaeon]|jgi:hypothetical protein
MTNKTELKSFEMSEEDFLGLHKKFPNLSAIYNKEYFIAYSLNNHLIIWDDGRVYTYSNEILEAFKELNPKTYSERLLEKYKIEEQKEYQKTISETDKEGINNALSPIKNYFAMLKRYNECSKDDAKLEKIKKHLDNSVEIAISSLNRIEKILRNK